jgi:SAM-dependent methyltransferase
MRPEEIWDVEAASATTPRASVCSLPRCWAHRRPFRRAGGRALELAIGTGRVAVPLAERGVPVTGIELSRPMVDRLRTKVDEDTIPVVVGDMATARAPGEYTLVYLVFNTISNLLTQAEQVACFRNAARHLAAGGLGRAGVPRHLAGGLKRG